MKKFFNFNKEKLKSRNSVIFVCVIALVCCIGVVNGKLSDKGTLGVSAGYEEYEQEEMDAHSGEVLVDSLNLQAAKGTSEQNDGQEESAGSSGTESADAGSCLYAVMQERISVLAVCGGKRRNNDLGTLGRHHGKRRVLEYRYEFI